MISRLSFSRIRSISLSRTALALAAIGLVAVTGLASISTPADAAAGINKTLNFQGRLLSTTGAVVPDGNYNMRFKLYQDGPGNVAGNTGGTLKWTELWQNNVATGSSSGVTVRNGYFSVNLATFCAFAGGSCQGNTNTAVDFNQDTLWLSMDVAGTSTSTTPTYDGELLPMRRLASAVYSLQAENANKLGGLDNTQFVQLAQGVQNDSSTANASIFINKTGTTADILDLQRGGADVVLINNAGQALFRPTTDSTAAFQVQKAGTTTKAFSVDTTNSRIGIGNIAPAYAVDAVGTVNATVSVLAPDFDRATAGTLTVGNTTATTINIGTNAAAHTIGIGTGAAAQTVAVGSTNTTSGTTISGGSGGITQAVSATGSTMTTINGTPVFSINSNGAATFKALSNDSNAFLIQGASGFPIINLATDVAGRIDNSSMEANPVTNWVYTGTAGGAVTRSTIHPYVGDAALRVATNGGANDGAKQTLSSTLSPSTSYTISWHAMSDGSFTGAVAAAFSWNGTNQSDCTGISTTNISQNGYTRYVCFFTTGSGAQAPNSSNAIIIKQTTASTQAFFIDGVTLNDGTTYDHNFYGDSRLRVNSLFNGRVGIVPDVDSTTAFQVRSQNFGTPVLNADTLNGFVGIGTENPQTQLDVNGAVRLGGTGQTSYISPLGTPINTKINIPNFDPGAYGQIMAMGVPFTTDSHARVLTLLDARGAGHQPTLNVLSPDESQTFGLNWNGSNSQALVDTSAGAIGLSTGGGTFLFDTASSGLSQFKLGEASSRTGVINFLNSTNSNIASIQSGATSTTYTSTLPTAIGSAGQCLTVASVVSSTQQLGYGACASGGVTLQGTTPGTPDTGNFNVSGTGIAGTALQSPILESTGTLGIGTNTATTITLGRSGQNLQVNSSLSTFTGSLLINGTTTANNFKGSVQGTLNSNVTTNQYGVLNTIDFNPSGASLSNIFAFHSGANISGSSLNISSLIGASAVVSTGAGYTGTVADARGINIGSPTIAGSQLFTKYTGLNIAANSANGGNTSLTKDNYQLSISAITAAAGTGGVVNNYGISLNQPSGAGGTTNNYGLYIQGAGGGSANWSLYNTSTAASYFAGQLSVGTQTTGYALNVSGALNQSTGALTLAGNAASSVTTTAGALTITSAAAATWSTGGTNQALTVQASGTGTLTLNTVGAGTVALGDSNTTQVQIGGTNGAATIIGGGNFAHTVQIANGSSSTAASVQIGSSGSSSATTIQGGTGGVITSATGSIISKSLTNSSTAMQFQNAAGESSLIAGTVSPNGTNGLTNSSFESGTSPWALKTGCTLSQDVTTARYGSASAKCVNTGTLRAGIKYPLTLADNTTYTFSFNVISATNGTIAYGYASDGATETGGSIPNSSTGFMVSDWRNGNISYTFTTPASHSGTPYLWIAQGDTTARTMNIDGVQIETGSNATPYRNGTFEFDGTVSNGLTLFDSTGTGLGGSATFVQSNGTVVAKIDANNAKAVFGGPTATNTLTVGIPATADFSANAFIMGLGSTNKGLVVQAAAGETGSLIELQNSTGGFLSSLTSTGNLLFGTDANHTISALTQTVANTAGVNLSISSATGAGTGAGGILALAGGTSGAGATGNGGAVTITGGNAGSTNGNGGSITLSGGVKTGTGVAGGVIIKPQASNDSAAAFQVQNAGGTNLVNVNTLTTNDNLWPNPSFEQNVNGAVVKGTSTVVLDSGGAVAKFGASHLEVVTGATASNGVDFRFPFKGSTTYSLSLWMRTFTGSATGISLGRADNGSDTDCLASQSVSTTWTQYTCSFTTGTTIGGTSSFYVKNVSGVTASIFIDGVTLVAGSNALSYALPGSELEVAPYYSQLSINANNAGEIQPWKLANQPATALSRAAVATANGFIYQLGGGTGVDGASPVNTVSYARANADGSLGNWSTTNTLGTAVAGAGATVINGYIYVIGGSTGALGSTDTALVQYARLNADGTTGTWSTTTPLPAVRDTPGVTSANGAIQVIGGNTTATTIATTLYARPNQDGTISAWIAGTTMPGGVEATQPVVSNGYIYAVGGSTSNGAGTNNDYKYAPLNSDGSMGTWTVQSGAGYVMPAAVGDNAVVAMNNYLYHVTGWDNTIGASSAVYFAQILSDGQLSTFATSANPVPVVNATAGRSGVENGKAVTLNGYIYLLGGDNTNAASKVVYYTSGPRTKVNGSLDLTSGAKSLNEVSSGGTLTAGNTTVVGTINVAGDANFQRQLQVTGGVTVGGPATFNSTTPSQTAFQVQNSTGASQLNVNTATANNLIANPSFETGSWTGWALRGSAAGGYVSTTFSNWGKASLFLQTSGASGNGIEYRVGLKPSTTYSLSFFARRDATSSAALSVGRNDNPPSASSATNDTNCTTTPASVVVTTTWTQFTCSFTTGATIANTSNIYIKQTDTTNDNIFIDGVTLVQSSTPLTYSDNLTGAGINVEAATSNITLNAGNNPELQPWRVNPNALSNTAGTVQPRSRAAMTSANGYVYVLGGGTASDGGTVVTSNTVLYAKINADGSLGTWTSNTNNLNTNVSGAGAVVVNGYIYLIGGSTVGGSAAGGATAAVATTQYARLNADGSTGAWTTTTALPAARYNLGVATYNGYIYASSGKNTSNVATLSLYYGKVNPDGTISSWTTSGTTWGNTREGFQMPVANGYLYAVGGGTANVDVFRLLKDGSVAATGAPNNLPYNGSDGGAVILNGNIYSLPGWNSTAVNITNASYVTPIEDDGTTNDWAALNTTLPVGTENYKAITVNGWIYVIGGDTAAGTQSTIYYTSTQRTLVNGSLDLVGMNGENLVDGNSGGSLTAGNTNVVGSLNVQDAANFAGNMTLSGTLSVGGATTFKNLANSTTAFTIQNAAGTALMTVDTSASTITFGSGGNTLTLASTGEPTLAGTARHAVAAVYAPEFPGIILDATNDTGGTVNCSTSNNGTLTSGIDLTNRMNYYNWTSTQAGGQCYDLAVQVPIPSDWSAWASTTPFSVQLYTSNTTDGQYAMEVRNSSGTAETSTASWGSIASLGSPSTWTAVSPSTLGSVTTGYTAGNYFTLRIRVQAKNNANFRVGNITINYVSKF